jgi:hypothetical protein
MEASKRARIMGRRFKVGVYMRDRGIVTERILEPGADVSLGGDERATLVVPDWFDPPQLVIEGTRLHLEPGMRVNMCHDQGEDHVVGTFEELTAAGLTFPLEIIVSKLNITVRPNISLFVKFLPPEP